MPNNPNIYYFNSDNIINYELTKTILIKTTPEKIKEMWERSIYFKKYVYKLTLKDLLATKKKSKPYYRVNERWG